MVKKRVHDLSEEPEVVVRPSKSEYKRITEKTAKFVHSLCLLTEKQLRGLGLPETVITIVLDAKKMKASGAKKRHLKNAISDLLNDEVWSHPDAVAQYDKVAQGHSGLKGFES